MFASIIAAVLCNGSMILYTNPALLDFIAMFLCNTTAFASNRTMFL
jgi:hypothetical protein